MINTGIKQNNVVESVRLKPVNFVSIRASGSEKGLISLWTFWTTVRSRRYISSGGLAARYCTLLNCSLPCSCHFLPVHQAPSTVKPARSEKNALSQLRCGTSRCHSLLDASPTLSTSEAQEPKKRYYSFRHRALQWVKCLEK